MIDVNYFIFGLVVTFLVINFFNYPFDFVRYLAKTAQKQTDENKKLCGIKVLLWQYFQILVMLGCFGICEYIVITKMIVTGE